MKRIQSEKDKEEKGRYHVKRQRFPRLKLERLLVDSENTLESQRCATDLVYRLFRRPQQVLPRLLPGLLTLIKKKNQPDLERSSMFRDAEAFLVHHPRADVRVKLFFVLIIVNRDEDAQALFLRSGYSANNMWGRDGTVEDGQAHFQRFLVVLEEAVNFVMGTPFTPGVRVAQVNVVNIVRAFVLEAEQLYLTC